MRLWSRKGLREGDETLGEDPDRVLSATRVGTEGRVNAASGIAIALVAFVDWSVPLSVVPPSSSTKA